MQLFLVCPWCLDAGFEFWTRLELSQNSILAHTKDRYREASLPGQMPTSTFARYLQCFVSLPPVFVKSRFPEFWIQKKGDTIILFIFTVSCLLSFCYALSFMHRKVTHVQRSIRLPFGQGKHGQHSYVSRQVKRQCSPFSFTWSSIVSKFWVVLIYCIN